ncbi:MAG: type III-A CRISPR-associated protein Cas10/Csm1 [Deltaproteobacteria bacterium]|nr:type III-A CRISPR-associated protein Cas10/Csm1 [Deltaproteobacteria bacterium]
MDSTTLKVAMAGFFHDIGKFADREVIGITEQYFNDNANIYLPFWNGRFTHHHALYTAGFIEEMRNYLPHELNSSEWGDGDSFINLAACHHKPETPMQQVITEADRLTSEMDRDEFVAEGAKGIAYQDYKKTRMLPLFEQLMKAEMDAEEKFEWNYPLARLSAESIFPVSKVQFAKEDAEAEYRDLYFQFVEELERIRHKEENILLWFEHFESLMMEFLSSVPAARAGKVVHDVSLYDHSRLTAAFAAAIYAYHKETGSLEIAHVRDREADKFLLVSGNFFGIQNFIFSGYGDTRKYRSKLLRGRSFYVSLLSELAADLLCRKLGLPFTSVILNAAGRFTVLAANTESTAQIVEDVKEEINDWLVGIGFGEISIGVSCVEAGCEDFSPGRFPGLWDRLAEEMDKVKFSKLDLDRHGGVITGYLDRIHQTAQGAVCPLCGRRPASREASRFLPGDDTGPVCRVCRDHVFVGTQLVRSNRVAILAHEEGGSGGDSLLEPLFGHYQARFPQDADKIVPDAGSLIKLWDISLPVEGKASSGIARKFLNNYVPVYDESDLRDERILATKKREATKEEMIEELELGEPMTFSHIAVKALREDGNGKARGVDALGILKADMDQLGLLMACGLEEQRQTISRSATLSRQVNHFFSLYLSHLLNTDQRFRCVYTVFAGGDDLFLIGPWNRAFELSLVLGEKFREYVCANPAVTLSSGISLLKPHTPLNTLADSAEQALEKSKMEGRDRLTMFGETANWTELSALDRVRGQLESWLEKGWMSKSMLYRLNDFIGMASMEKEVLQKKEITSDDMPYLKWRALFSYSAARNIGKGEKGEKREEIIRELLPVMTEWLETHGGRLRIPLWTVLYEHR